ncbi:F-box and WD-40 domain protein 5 [Mytilus galloprovincialis]|uniref:F-box and WD-40 domain protein 5 n=1 Tax=Mytilus galloprovincialis TaxID=29158 RepID=A0A8B6EDF2_MYTGA|nr:F-box and WD-40 domain protein 5 [Mytilus galloprovincialis]
MEDRNEEKEDGGFKDIKEKDIHDGFKDIKEKDLCQDNVWNDGSIWQHMPDDFIIHIFSFLDCNSLLEASKTCSKWRRVAIDESLWKDLVSFKVGLPRASLPDCESWYKEFRRLCMNVPVVESEVLKEHEDEVYHVMFSPSGKYFSSTGKDGNVIVWELGMPTTMFTKKLVVDLPSYTRFSEFNQSETKLLVAGMDMGYFYDGFIKIYQFGKELIELCLVRVEFPNFRGAWYDDNNFISMGRASEDGHGYFLQVRTHKAEKKICQHEFSELLKIRHCRHRNDFVRIIDKSKWPKADNSSDCETDYNMATCDASTSARDCDHDPVTKKQKQEDNESDEDDNENACNNVETQDKYLILYQTSLDYRATLYKYGIDYNVLNDAESGEVGRMFTPPHCLYECDGTCIGTSLSNDHRYLAYCVRQKILGEGFSLYDESIEVRVYDLQNDLETKEVYKGARSVGEDHVSYIFPSVSKNFVACGSENLKGYIWDRRYGVILSELNHECGIHSQNGVNATAFCPTDQEVLVTVADDLNIRVWRSRQAVYDTRIASVIDLPNKPYNQNVIPPSIDSDSDSPDEVVMDDLDDGKTTCCYGLKNRKLKAKITKKR